MKRRSRSSDTSDGPRGSALDALAGLRAPHRRVLARLAALPRWALLLAVLALLVLTANLSATWRATSIAQSMSTGQQLRVGGEEKPAAPAVAVQIEDEFSTEAQQEMEKQLIYSLHLLAQQTTQPRGIVLPLFDGIATLGVSLIMELRAMAIDLPIEIPHCGDLDAAYIRTLSEQKELGVLHFYNVCERAGVAASRLDPTKKLFCRSMTECHRRFRNFDIKLLAVIFSRFEELMMLDADAIFFQDPTQLWETDKYKATGTLFFHDRLSQDDMFLGLPIKSKPGVNDLNQYLGDFDVTPFRHLATIARPNHTLTNNIPVQLKYEPSDHLLTSHAWNHRAGHEMDSSLVLWSKKRQPRATAILGSIIVLNDIRRPPSYGDKEFFFISCELAETQYSFSDFGVGGVGTDFRDHGEDKSIVCGQAAHYYPVRPEDGSDASLLYLNSDDILKYDPWRTSVYYSKARAADFYPGSFYDRDLPQECPFDVTGVKLSTKQNERISLRQRFHEIAVQLKKSST